MRKLAWLTASTVAGAALVWRGYRNALNVTVENVTLCPTGLPPGLDGVRLLLLSDLHLPGVADAPRRLIEIVERLSFDAVLIAGDLVDTQDGMEQVFEVASYLAERAPTFAVFGSHDHYEPRLDLRNFPKALCAINDGQHLRAELESRSIRVLHNERETVQVGGRSFDVIGLADAYLGYDDLAQAVGTRSLDGFNVVLAHSPDVLPSVEERSLPVLFAGHTHGGQIAFPLIGAPFTHARTYRWRRPAGLRQYGRTLSYVSRGFGTTMVPLRFNARPEVTIVTLAFAPRHTTQNGP